MRIVRAAGILTAAFAFVACNAILGNESDYRLVPAEGGARSCLLRSECPTGQICIFRTCSPQCLGDIDCDVGARCLRTPDGPACVTTDAAECSGATCPEGTTCSAGTCRNDCEETTDCLANQECTRSKVCVGTDVTRDPGGVSGSGGASGSGGKTGTGGKSGSGGTAPASGGTAGTGGTTPIVDGGPDSSADSGPGPGPCVASGPENCFNDKDDDCNGDTDCEDAACKDPATCVPDAPGGSLGTLSSAGACPTGFTSTTLQRGLKAEYGCSGCSCVPAGDARCETGVYAHGSYPCPSYQFSGPLYNVLGSRCDPMPADASLHYYGVRGFTTCTPQGTGTPLPASWDEKSAFCAATKTGGGCGAGARCIPKLPVQTPSCAMTVGAKACGGAYPTTTGETWFTGYDDKRVCLECSCSFGSATCAGAYIQGFTGGSCTGSPVTIGNGAEGDACPLGAVVASARVVGTPTSPSCPPNTPMTGEINGTGPHTVCCQ
jgi:hypothetical protein